MATELHLATGRRKTSTARVYLSEGSGNLLVNERPALEYFKKDIAVPS